MDLIKDRRVAALVATLLVVAAAIVAARMTGASPAASPLAKYAFGDNMPSQGVENGGQGGESAELLAAAQQFAEARTAPSGIVNPGAYSAALGQLSSLPTVGGSWTDITKVPYDADDPNYRDYFSNSSGG